MFNDNVIYETENFIVVVPKVPHIPREDGGHIWIKPQENCFSIILDLSSKEALEVMRLTMLISESLIKGMKNRNINNKQESFRTETFLFIIYLFFVVLS